MGDELARRGRGGGWSQQAGKAIWRGSVRTQPSPASSPQTDPLVFWGSLRPGWELKLRCMQTRILPFYTFLGCQVFFVSPFSDFSNRPTTIVVSVQILLLRARPNCFSASPEMAFPCYFTELHSNMTFLLIPFLNHTNMISLKFQTTSTSPTTEYIWSQQMCLRWLGKPGIREVW